MKKYSRFFETLYDEQEDTGKIGRGCHYSILRAQYKKSDFFYFAVIWDEDHDERVLECLEWLYEMKLLHHYLLVGERKGGFTAISPPGQQLTNQSSGLPEGFELSEGDYWTIHVFPLEEVGNGYLIHSSEEKIRSYANGIVEHIETIKKRT